MKKSILLIVAILGIASANAQFKESGFKVIGEVGVGISNATASADYEGLTVSGSAFGFLSPDIEISLGANVMPQMFLGIGVGYNTLIGISDLDGTGHEGKVFAHGRFYFSQESNGVFVDLKAGYKKCFTGEKPSGFDMFVGPGFMFGGKYTITAGYAGSFYDGLKFHGGAVKFGIEF